METDDFTPLQRARRSGRCVSDYEIDGLISEALTVEEAAEVRARIDDCSHCQERLASLLASKGDFEERSMQALSHPVRRRSPFAIASGVVGLAAAVALTFHFGTTKTDGIRIKGGDSFGFIIVAPDGSIVGDQTAETVSPGDQLQWRFRVSETRYIAVLGVDGEGTAAVYYPADDRAGLLAPGPETTLPSALEMDAVAGTETLLGLICEKQVELEPIRSMLERTKTVELPRCDVHTYQIRKRIN